MHTAKKSIIVIIIIRYTYHTMRIKTAETNTDILMNVEKRSEKLNRTDPIRIAVDSNVMRLKERKMPSRKYNFYVVIVVLLFASTVFFCLSYTGPVIFVLCMCMLFVAFACAFFSESHHHHINRRDRTIDIGARNRKMKCNKCAYFSNA